MKLNMEKFGRSIKFGLWQVKMKVILVQNSVQKAINGVEKMTKGMSVMRWEEIDAKALSAI